MQYMSKTLIRWFVVNHKHFDYASTASTLVKDITIMLYGGKIRAVENEYMLLLLTSANGFLCTEK